MASSLLPEYARQEDGVVLGLRGSVVQVDGVVVAVGWLVELDAYQDFLLLPCAEERARPLHA